MLELSVSLAMCSSPELGGGNGLQSIGTVELESAILITISVGITVVPIFLDDSNIPQKKAEQSQSDLRQ